MAHINIEIKAKCRDFSIVQDYLQRNAEFKGIDTQTDTYYRVNRGRLKLRQENIENALIYYKRENKNNPKESKVILYPNPEVVLESILNQALGILVIVKKRREIYFIENVKFHLDIVENLGKFLEIEAIDIEGNLGRDKLLLQCKTYMEKFKIQKKDLVSCSYSDLILQKYPR